jgi:hypothetical protein
MRADLAPDEPGRNLERDARTARIFCEALARRARKIARGEPVNPPLDLSPGDDDLAGAVTHGT